MSRKYKKRISIPVSYPRVKKVLSKGALFWCTTFTTPRVKAWAKKPPKWKAETIRLGNIRYNKRPYKCQYDDCIFP